MKTLHFISLNNCFVSIHVVVRFTHASQITIMQFLFQVSTPEKRVPYVARAEEQVVH